jgi:transmembrane sensor
MEKKRLQELIALFSAGQATEAEKKELFDFIQTNEDSRLFEEAGVELMLRENAGNFDQALYGDLIGKVLNLDKNEAGRVISVNAGGLASRRILRYAAAILLIAGAAVTWYFISQNRNTTFQQVAENSKVGTDIQPGGQKATLTLSDGRVIVIDSATGGHLADESGVAILKTDDGQIVYDPSSYAGSETEVQWNTLTTPKGGQTSISLPDGSKVWLNSSSSITFPAVFTGKTREVRTRGEVYFEVTGNANLPFIVDIDGMAKVEVLGTNFNINSYADEGIIRTTLIEGSIRLNLNTAENNRANTAVNTASAQVILKPGQQGMISLTSAGKASPINVLDQVDIEQIMAWKNGLFNFNGYDLRTVMRQLERNRFIGYCF